MLCSKCEKIFSDDHEKSINEPGEFGEWYVHHKIGNLLPTPQNAECHLCAILAWQYEDAYEDAQGRIESGRNPGVWKYDPQLEYDLGPFDTVIGLQLIFRLAPSKIYEKESFDRRELSVQFHRVFNVLPAQTMQKNLHFQGSKYECVSHFTGDESCWNLFHLWLKQCDMDHQLCRLRSDPHIRYPTRLLHIDGDWPDKPFDHIVRLQITAEEELAGPYMTLSHCWGGNVPLMLTDSTMERLKTGIRVKDLPKSFAHAVCLTASCDIQYLWIDSLCIIQGSEDDWREESSKMGHIYSNAYCNIAATGSPNSSGGCFRRRDPMLVRPVAVNATWKLDTANPDSPPPGDYICVRKDYWSHGVDEAPLGKRAWVIQERYLAPRQLHMSDEQIFWECREHAACETFPGGAPAWGHTMPTKNFASDIEELTRFVEGEEEDLATVSARSCSERLEDIYQGWDRAINMYSRCELTFGRDKLVAISGLAEKMQLATGEEYVAGLWRDNLPSQLLWRIYNPVRSNRQYAIRPRPLRAPTWSWVSMDADIDTLPHTRTQEYMKSMIEVTDVSVSQDSGGESADFERGHLRLRGLLCRASIHDSGHGQEKMMLRINLTDIEGNVLPDEVLQAMAICPPQTLEDLHLHCLPVLSGQSVAGGEIFWIFGLLLRPIENTKDEFERFGYFDTRSPSSLAAILQACAHVDQVQVDSTNDHRVTITIR